MTNTNEIVNEAIEHVTTEAIDDVADAIVANDAVTEVNGNNGIGPVEATLMIAGGAALIYVAVKGVKWAKAKIKDANEVRKAKKAAKMAAKQAEIVADVEAEEAECDEDAVEA